MYIILDFAVQNTTIKYNNSDIKNIDKTCNKVNSKFDAKNEIKLEDNYNYCNMGMFDNISYLDIL